MAGLLAKLSEDKSLDVQRNGSETRTEQEDHAQAAELPSW
jgi:hypothetical protein